MKYGIFEAAGPEAIWLTWQNMILKEQQDWQLMLYRCVWNIDKLLIRHISPKWCLTGRNHLRRRILPLTRHREHLPSQVSVLAEEYRSSRRNSTCTPPSTRRCAASIVPYPVSGWITYCLSVENSMYRFLKVPIKTFRGNTGQGCEFGVTGQNEKYRDIFEIIKAYFGK